MLELKNVSFKVPTENGTKTVIDNVSLKIDERFVAFTGPNGGGKSTLAKLIAGIYLIEQKWVFPMPSSNLFVLKA